MALIKPERLRRGDKVAVVSLSAGILGEEKFIHKYYLAKQRLEEEFGLQVACMEHALRGAKYLSEHPEARAQDLMDAFRDPSIRGVISAIGGDDTIRLLPYIDFSVLHDNPKIFTGFSDTTSNHLMLHRAGLVSYYGPCVMCNFSEYVKINDYTREMIVKTFFEPPETLEIPAAPYWYDDEDEKIWWCEENMNRAKAYHPETRGYELLQGAGVAEGELLGGCADVFIQLTGTPLWPSREEWRGKLLFLETSEEDMSPDCLCWILRNLCAQGIFDEICGVLVGKPARRSKYEPYKQMLRRVIALEAGHPELPVLCNLNFGHAEPIGVLPIGLRCRLDADARRLTLLEPATR